MQSVIEKFEKQETIRKNPLIIFFDIDATISTYSPSGVMANRKTSRLLKENFIPFILITGRPNWYWFSNLEIKLYGLHKPDAVITGNGTSLFWKNSHNNWEKDIQWNELIFKDWNIEKIKKICSEFKFTFPVIKKTLYKNKPLLLYRVVNAPTKILFSDIERLKKLLPKNVDIDISESLIFRNTEKVFSGGIFIVPEICGKAGAVKYIIDKLIMFSKNNSTITSCLFGDASIDIPMLSLKSNKRYFFKSYLVNPTPLAKSNAKRSERITILSNKGPGEIFKIINSELDQPLNTKKHFLRKYFSEPTKDILDKIYPQNISATNITHIGITKIINSVDALYLNPKASRIKAISNYLFGLFADVADGIRARKTSITKQGQLTDDFADRVKEFYPLYIRAQRRLTNTPQRALITFKAALSCILTGVARRQAEINGHYFNEGATFLRTRKLFLSLLYDTILNQTYKSFLIDQEILNFSQKTYIERLKKSDNFNLKSFTIKDLSSLQQNAFERWLLYIQLFQEEHYLIKQILPENLKEDYYQWLKSIKMLEYVKDLDVETFRKKFGFTNYDLYLKRFIS